MDTPLRITFVLPQLTLAGGIRVAAIYAAHLLNQGHRVTIVSTPAPDLSFSIRFKNFLKGTPVHRPVIVPNHFDSVPANKILLDRYRPVTDDDVPDADVVIATWWETAEWVSKLSPRKGTKIHLIQHDETQIPNQPTDRVEATWQLPNFRRVAVAAWLEELGRLRYGVRDITHINNGVDTALFNAAPRKKQRVPTVGVMYSNVPFKGCDISIEAFELARRSVPNLTLRAYGAEEASANLPLPDGTELVCRPEQDAIREVYAACDAWLFASRSEGFGLPILEAMACRTPVIGAPAGAAPELIAQGGGVLVKPQDPMDMAIAIERFARMTDAEWQTYSEAAHAIAQRNTWPHAARRFEQLLRDSLPRIRVA
jgi:glycosyltransferase involved in cell wall biosynthesis